MFETCKKDGMNLSKTLQGKGGFVCSFALYFIFYMESILMIYVDNVYKHLFKTSGNIKRSNKS